MATVAADQRSATAPAHRRPRQPLQVRILRVVGWVLIGAGAVVVLYLIYSLLFTNLETNAAQADLAERWSAEVSGTGPDGGAASTADPRAVIEPIEREGDESQAGDQRELAGDDPAAEPVIDPGAAQAVLEFVRPGSDEPIVRDGPLFVVDGVSPAVLRNGPGHYPGTAKPGQDGNFAVAGHRTTYGAPFFAVDELVPGDEIHATGRDGVRHVYVVREQRIVRPSDVWVVGPDPLGTDRPTLTLTSCHPRFSQAQRIIVFAELAA